MHMYGGFAIDHDWLPEDNLYVWSIIITQYHTYTFHYLFKILQPRIVIIHNAVVALAPRSPAGWSWPRFEKPLRRAPCDLVLKNTGSGGVKRWMCFKRSLGFTWMSWDKMKKSWYYSWGMIFWGYGQGCGKNEIILAITRENNEMTI